MDKFPPLKNLAFEIRSPKDEFMPTVFDNYYRLLKSLEEKGLDVIFPYTVAIVFKDVE